jgi:DNA-binding transcriptional LysR family regulator
MLPELVHHSEKLFYFYEIANTGSYQATARKLGLSAPTLSYAIKKLEEVIKAPVFNRGSKGVTVTDAGEKLLAFCRRFYRDVEDVQRQIRQGSLETIERIRFGTYQSIAIYFWPNLVEALGSHPNLSMSMMTNRSQVVLESLIQREIDMALTVEDFQDQGLTKHELYKDQYSLYGPAHLKSGHLKKADVTKFPLLYIPDAVDATRKTLRQHLHSWDLKFRDEFELDSFEVIGEFVKKGYGIGILPIKVAKQYGDSIKKLKVEGVPARNFGTHRFFLSYREDLDIPQKLMKTILEAANSAVRLEP